MIVKYTTNYSGDRIERVECIRETAACVYVASSRASGERREAKHSEFIQYHDSWDEARTHLLDKAQRKVDSIRLSLDSAKGKLGNIKGMKNPETTA